ncbi:hypothetical protein RD792_001351 [Penstemon davidsonii]|uniref:mitogen-activated protein kinase kinase kinase n=1 Tax=Penstemon davidsonii TaxID=160366 RepID=A0ABR0DNV2_9LAMI|nr:hypothetical protein RD792_001351 [Penstemon davidsonii]
MPAWWGKKSGRSKDSDNNSSAKSSSAKKGKENENKVRNFDEVLLRNSPRNSGDFLSPAGNSSGFSGFDSLDRGHPLPRPINSLESANDQGQGHGPVFGTGSGSVSSVSSSGSSDEHTPPLAASRGHVVDNRLSPLMRSPNRGSRTATSPLRARLSGISLDSSTGDGRSECHRLPLPPGSPSSPSSLPTPRSPSSASEGSTCNSSKWRKGRLLGRGTFGHVYLGFNSENGQMCAIKEVKVVSDDQSSKESLKQLNQEITLLSQLSHANIVQYYGSDLSEERLSVFLEYVSGGSIHKLLQEYGAFGEPVIQNYTRQILSGLAYLHGRNTVHRDIKGANILVDPNGEIKLADFGMIASCSSMLSFKGSPYWMAPEVVMNTNGYSLPVDIWSLGCTVLEMATSKPPWSQYEGVAAIFKIGNSKDTPEIPEHLSADAKGFIRLCLQREPSARPTAAQLLSHPFVRNQTTIRATNVNITREAFPRAFDGSRTPTALELHSNRTNNHQFDRDDASSRLTIPRTLLSPRDNARTIASSMPVSPSSSPLRHDNRSFFLSPPHPSYNTYVGHSYNNDHSVFPTSRPNSRTTIDPWLDIPQYRAQAPTVRSPTRIML